MIPGYVRERKCVKLCSLSFSLFKKIKFKVAKILSTAMGIFCTLSRFPVRKCLNVREEKKVVTGGYFARSEWESLLGFTASGLASAGNGHCGHVGNPLASAGISRKAQCSTARYYTLKGHGPLVAILHKSTPGKCGGTASRQRKKKPPYNTGSDMALGSPELHTTDKNFSLQ